MSGIASVGEQCDNVENVTTLAALSNEFDPALAGKVSTAVLMDDNTSSEIGQIRSGPPANIVTRFLGTAASGTSTGCALLYICIWS